MFLEEHVKYSLILYVHLVFVLLNDVDSLMC